MKTIIPKTSLVLLSSFIILLYSCNSDIEINKDPDPNFNNFDFKTTKQLKVSISTLNSEDKPVGGVFMRIYTKNPLTPEGLLKDISFLIYYHTNKREIKLFFS